LAELTEFQKRAIAQRVIEEWVAEIEFSTLYEDEDLAEIDETDLDDIWNYVQRASVSVNV
jgi:hypothetical protein